MSEKVKLFIFDRLPNEPLIHLIGLYNGTLETESTLFTSALPADFMFTTFEFTEDKEQADYILIPSGIRALDENTKAYLDRARALSKQIQKPIIALPAGDLAHVIDIPDMILVRGSQYGHRMRKNEVLIPPFSEDIGSLFGVTIRKKSTRPLVGFCGWAGFPTLKSHVRYIVETIALDLVSRIPSFSYLAVYKKGVYWRRKSMEILSKDRRIDTKFITRNSFSGSIKTISLAPEDARREYVENMAGVDFALTPKGDANASIRLYEALSMGRVPIIIDTDMPLPFEEVLDYTEFALRVPHTKIQSLADVVCGFHASITDEQFVQMQQKARKAYLEYLRYDAVFNKLFITGAIARAGQVAMAEALRA